MLKRIYPRVALVAGCAAALVACNSAGTDGEAAQTKIVLAAYTTPREAYGEIIPMFQEAWRTKTGEEVAFEESYVGSGTQSRAIVEGFEADIAALSLAADISRIQEAGLITHDWRAGASEGMVSRSVVAFAVRPGNPKGIFDWPDLARPGVEIVMPNPKTSGGAQWNVLAAYGAAVQGHVPGVHAGDPESARGFLGAILANVTVMDKAARESITSFEKGIGDVAVTYENEVLVGRQSGQDYELVIPASTILIENPVALVDAYADKHGVREAAEAFIAFLTDVDAQVVFADHGLRSVAAEVAEQTSDRYPPVEHLFTIDDLGGWSEVTPAFFGEEGIFTQTMAEVQSR